MSQNNERKSVYFFPLLIWGQDFFLSPLLMIQELLVENGLMWSFSVHKCYQ